MTSQRTEMKVSASASNRIAPATLPNHGMPSLPSHTTATTTSTSPSSYPLLGSSALNTIPSGFTPTSNSTLPANYSSAAGAPITTATSYISVLNWIQFVLHKLAEIQWRQIGTELGTARPLFEMTNPNQAIEEIYQR
jgi:hypothetical protein